MKEVCGECRYFRLRKDSEFEYAYSDGECLNRKVTKTDKDFDTDACNLFEEKGKLKEKK